MRAAADPSRRKREDLLLEHCASVARLERPRTPAHDRLERTIGGDLARRLVGALAGDHRMPARLFAD